MRVFDLLKEPWDANRKANVALAAMGLGFALNAGAFAFLYLSTVDRLNGRIASLEQSVERGKLQIAANHTDAIQRIEKVAHANFEDVIVPLIRVREINVVDSSGKVRIQTAVRTPPGHSDTPFVAILDEEGRVATNSLYQDGLGHVYVKGGIDVQTTGTLGYLRVIDDLSKPRLVLSYEVGEQSSYFSTFNSSGSQASYIGLYRDVPYIQLQTEGVPFVSFSRDAEGYVATYTKNNPTKDFWGVVSNLATAWWAGERLGILR